MPSISPIGTRDAVSGNLTDTRLPRVLRRTRAFHNRLGWARLTSIMMRVTYLAVTLIPRVETASSWPPLQSPMRFPPPAS